MSFAESEGLVYFGYVSQRDDDHHILRGMTVSNEHHDDHYCIGTYDEHDIVFVERSDTLANGKRHHWHIMEFDLKTTADIPHVLIGSMHDGHGFHELLKTKYPKLQPAQLGHTADYSATPSGSLTVYTTPAHVLDVERLIPPETAAIIASHFDGLVIELTDQAVYVYSERFRASAELLNTMLKNGAWLTNQINQNSRSL